MREIERSAHSDATGGNPAIPEPARDDRELLRLHASGRDDSAFQQIVNRYVDLVHSAAWRQTGNHALAQDVTQAVFVALARKAAVLSGETVLSGWLFRAVRYAAIDACKMERRRQRREHEAALMEPTHSTDDGEPVWEQLAPLLDEALTVLGETDRRAILLRFFEKKSFGEIGVTLGGNEISARARVLRAVEKLRVFFRRRGVAISALALGGALLGNAVQAAPAWLATAVAVQTAPARLAEAIVRRLRWRRVARVGSVLALALLLSGIVTVAFRERHLRQAAELAEAARSVRELALAIDRTYTFNDPAGFADLVYFRNAQEERSRPVLTNFVRAQWLFRQQMQRIFNVRQRTFDATFRELCVWRPPAPFTFIGAESAATNIMMARYPVRFVRAGGAWKWDLFTGLSSEAREQRLDVLVRKAALLDQLTGQLQAHSATNVAEILETLGPATP